MPVTVTNLIQGPAEMWFGTYGTYTEPAVNANTLNNTPGACASGWTAMGGTLDGVTIQIGHEYSELAVDQIVDVPGRRLTKRDPQLKGNLAEGTLENLAAALNGGTVATGTGYKTYTPAMDTSATQATYGGIILEGISVNSLKRRVLGRRVLNVEAVESAYKKDEQWVLPTAFATHYVTDVVTPYAIYDKV
jgi:hypothetical protein